MDQDKKIKADVFPQENIVGGAEYSITVRISNISNTAITDLIITTSLSAGMELSGTTEVENSGIDELEEKKRRIIREIEKQIQSAYSKQRYRKLSFSDKLALSVAEVIEMYASFFSKRRNITALPIWAIEALKVDDWEDVERLEKELIINEADDSFLKKSFNINKDKLERILKTLGHETEKASFVKGVNLEPGETLAFPFVYKAPHLMKTKSFNVQHKLSYKYGEDNKQINSSTEHKINISPSPFAVPTGGMIGALGGYFIRLFLMNAGDLSVNWAVLCGSVLLGLLVSVLTARKPNTTKAITVEDFVGGIIIGALVGMFSDVFITKLAALIK